ncbi:MAG: S41 family peptidase [Nitrospinae bacterium]|nr:S41 family peptidase [Nitrospinota bacterium]
MSQLLATRAGGIRRVKHLTICLTLMAAVFCASLVFPLSNDQEEAIALLYEVMEKVEDSYARTPDFRKMYVAGLEGLKKSAGEGRFEFEEKAGDEVLLKAGEKELLVRLRGDTDGGLGGFERAYRFAMGNAEDSEKKKKGGLHVMYAALSSMLRALDPYSAFVTPEAYRQMRVEHTGRYGGVGVIITVRDKKLTVISPIEDTPAHRAGLKSEDVILEIDGASTADMPLSDVVRRMRGPAGKTVDLLISRASWPEPRKVTLRRAIISIRSVKTEVKEGGIGYLRVTAFHGRTTRELDVGLNELISKKVRGIVLDLRDNPGGFLRQSVRVSERFLPDGSMVVFTRGRRRSETVYFRSRGSGVWVGKPLIVLINKGSASASEIVAGALQDLDRALIIGRTSFGKGSVQAIIPTRGKAAVRLTTSKYYTPLGRLIHEKGIQPDVEAGSQPLTKKEISERRREMKSSLYKKEKTDEKKIDAVLELAMTVLKDARSADVEALRRAALHAQRLMRSAEAVSSAASP